LSHITLGTKFQVQNTKFKVSYTINLKIFNKNVNFSKNITIRFIQKVN